MLGLVIAIVAVVISLSAVTIQLISLRRSVDNIAIALGHTPQPE